MCSFWAPVAVYRPMSSLGCLQHYCAHLHRLYRYSGYGICHYAESPKHQNTKLLFMMNFNVSHCVNSALSEILVYFP